jgi:hypothetical protein
MAASPRALVMGGGLCCPLAVGRRGWSIVYRRRHLASGALAFQTSSYLEPAKRTCLLRRQLLTITDVPQIVYDLCDYEAVALSNSDVADPPMFASEPATASAQRS